MKIPVDSRHLACVPQCYKLIPEPEFSGYGSNFFTSFRFKLGGDSNLHGLIRQTLQQIIKNGNTNRLSLFSICAPMLKLILEPGSRRAITIDRIMAVIEIDPKLIG